MSGGSNGLSAVANLSDRTKCPTSPTKRKWCDGDLAREEAERRTKSINRKGVAIEAYACEGCGCYHLTKSSGGTNYTLADGKFSVGEFQKLAPTHPVFAEPGDPEPPIIPGDHETRVKFARRYLDDCPADWEPTTAEMCEVIGGCTKESLRKVMRELGYSNTRGRNARWVKTHLSLTPPEVGEETTEGLIDLPEVQAPRGGTDLPDARIPLDLSYDNDAPEPGQPHWIDLSAERVRHLAVGDLIDAYAAAGLSIRIQVEVG